MTEQRSSAELEELLGAYALDAVDADEREQVERHLAECPRCRAELGEHLEVAGQLGQGGGAAPDGLWGRIASSLEEAPPAMRLEVAPVVPLASRRRKVVVRAMTAVVGVAAVVIVVLGIVVVRQERRIDDVSREVAQIDVRRAAGQAIADTANTKTMLTQPDGQTEMQATAVVTGDGTGFLLTTNVPELPADRTYQLWGVMGDKVISLGVLGNKPSVAVFQVDGDMPVDGYALTEEVAGGVVSSQNPPMLVGKAA